MTGRLPGRKTQPDSALGPLSLPIATYATGRHRPKLARVYIKEAKFVMTNSTYPVKVNAQLDTKLSRGLWLVKWLLAIPTM